MPFYKFKDHSIFYEDRGAGPCLFFVHEWNSSSLSFRKLNQQYLAEKVRVICIDLPGYGNSAFMEGLQFDDFSLMLIELLDYLKIKECSFMGFCLGATILLDLYLKFPDRVKFLILIEPVLKYPRILVPLLIPGFGVAFLRFLASHRLLFSLVGSRLIGADNGLYARVHKSMSRYDPKISKLYLYLLFKKSRQFDFHKLNFDLQNKCICIIGENTNILFKKNADSLVNQYHIRECMVLKNTGHFSLIERPVEISAIVFKHLLTLEG